MKIRKYIRVSTYCFIIKKKERKRRKGEKKKKMLLSSDLIKNKTIKIWKTDLSIVQSFLMHLKIGVGNWWLACNFLSHLPVPIKWEGMIPHYLTSPCFVNRTDFVSVYLWIIGWIGDLVNLNSGGYGLIDGKIEWWSCGSRRSCSPPILG